MCQQATGKCRQTYSQDITGYNSMNLTSDTGKLQSIYITHLGESINDALVDELLINGKGAIRHRDAYLIKRPYGEAWLFNYGVLACWNLTTDERQQLCLDLSDLIVEPNTKQFSEEYRYRIDTEEDFRIKHDVVYLDNSEPLSRLALSHAFAQSTKLQVFEEKAQKVIQGNRFISKDLAKKAKISLSRRKLAMLRGLLFETSSDISLHFSLLDTPEFFWDYPEFERYYSTLTKYLDLKPRIEILNHKLATIHEMLDMLAAEQHHKHSAFLEWIIIILIAIDIVIYFLPK